jgi:putative RecB family exonuclease
MIRPMPFESTILIAPSMAAVVELPRRLASTGRALAGLYPFKPMDLARAIAEPGLLAEGLQHWDTGHGALLAARLLEGPHALRLPSELPTPPLARALARTLASLRMAGADPARLATLASRPASTGEDEARLRAVAQLYRAFGEAVEGRFADPAAILRAARDRIDETAWLRGATVLIVEDLELDPLEKEFLAALAKALPVRLLEAGHPPSLAGSSFASWAAEHGVRTARWGETLLAPLAPAAAPKGLERLRELLFESAAGAAIEDGSVELLTAPGEAAEVRALVRRLLLEASRGVPFEEMGVVLPRPETYAPLFSDLLERLQVPYRLHPSLPLRFGRCARSLLLLLRCRGLPRAAVMEFLTFVPAPFEEMLGEDTPVRPAQWDALSRDAGIVSGLERWIIGLRAHAEAEREAAEKEADEPRRDWRRQRAGDAEALLRIVELLGTTLDGLAGEAPWSEWSERLGAVFDQWIGKERDREAVGEVLSDLAGLGSLAGRAPWTDVEQVLEARFEWERLPLEAIAGGGIHVGALDAMAGLTFRVVAIPGLVEGGYPGVLRPDPFLLDPEREALAAPREVPKKGQLGLFDETSPAPATALPTTQDRLLEARRLFHRAIRQATERLFLSYPRADPRSGRERMPSLFFVAAASAREGRPLAAQDLDRIVVEDVPERLEDALDASERDRIRIRSGGRAAALAIASGSGFFQRSHLASEARWSSRLTPHDGLVSPLPPDLARLLDPLTSPSPVSASRLATFSRCGFQYLLRYVLRLEPALEPEERKRLDPLERGSLFHEVAEHFLRERRDRGELPVRDIPALQARLLEMSDAALEAFVAGSPPRFTLLWEREKRRFRETMAGWLGREAAAAGKATPAHFEVGFGLSREGPPGEPHLKEPLVIELGDGRALRVSGQIDRIDRRPDRTLVLRDYKTGRAPLKDDGSVFRGGKQLQIPFYVLAAARIFPDEPVVHAFLDYVDGGRQVAFDPASASTEAFRHLLRGLTDAIAQGVFVQEPTSCEYCDYTAVCGPRPLLERRRRYKLGDRLVQAVLRLRDVP